MMISMKRMMMMMKKRSYKDNDNVDYDEDDSLIGQTGNIC